jgi:hypothetical protein
MPIFVKSKGRTPLLFVIAWREACETKNLDAHAGVDEMSVLENHISGALDGTVWIATGLRPSLLTKSTAVRFLKCFLID